MRDMKTVIASWLAGLFAIGFALFSLWLPLYSKLVYPSAPASNSDPARVTVTLLPRITQYLNYETGVHILFAALMLIAGLLVMFRMSAGTLRLLRNMSLCTVLYMGFARFMIEACNQLPKQMNWGCIPPPEEEKWKSLEIQIGIGFQAAFICAAAAFIIAAYGCIHAKRLLAQQPEPENTDEQGA